MPGSSTARRASCAHRALSVESDRRGPDASSAAVATSPCAAACSNAACTSSSSTASRADASSSSGPGTSAPSVVTSCAKYRACRSRDRRFDRRVDTDGRERADGLQQPEAPSGPARRALDERFFDELREPIGGREHVVIGDARRGGEVERTAERAEHEQELTFAVVEQSIRPVDRVVERECGA